MEILIFESVSHQICPNQIKVVEDERQLTLQTQVMTTYTRLVSGGALLASQGVGATP